MTDVDIDLAHLHDCIYGATGVSHDVSNLVKLFDGLPDSIRDIAIEWGMSDTEFGDKVVDYFREEA